jgi:hypothetical protein
MAFLQTGKADLVALLGAGNLQIGTLPGATNLAKHGQTDTGIEMGQ